MKFLTFLLLWGWSVCAVAAGSIEGYVTRAPKIRQHDELSDLVQYLVGPYHTDKDKALSLLTWIVYNIDYDDYVYRQKDRNNKSRRDLSKDIPAQGDIIQTRLGVCIDIANLYTEMLKMADIQAQTITGCHAGPNDKVACRENPHAWNAVWIDKQWVLVDPTFAMGEAKSMQDVSSKRTYNRVVKKREKRSADTYQARTNRIIDLDWFMVDPDRMAQTHQPDDKRWLLKKRADRKKSL